MHESVDGCGSDIANPAGGSESAPVKDATFNQLADCVDGESERLRGLLDLNHEFGIHSFPFGFQGNETLVTQGLPKSQLFPTIVHFG